MDASPGHLEFLREMEAELHELCQPLTALQFRLECSTLIGGIDAWKEAVEGSLEDTQRMIKVVQRIRSRLLCECASPTCE